MLGSNFRQADAAPMVMSVLGIAHDRTRTDDLFLTKEVLLPAELRGLNEQNCSHITASLERETGFEPATLSLEGWSSAI